MASSSDDDGYSSTGSNYDSEDDEFLIKSRKRRRGGNGKEQNIYGVFYDNYEGDNNRRKSTSYREQASEPLQFVSASNHDAKDEVMDDDKDDSLSQESILDDDEGDNGDAKFMALMEQATKKNRSSFAASVSHRSGEKKHEVNFAEDDIRKSEVDEPNASEEFIPMMGAGLGYHKGNEILQSEGIPAAAIGLGFSSGARFGFMAGGIIGEQPPARNKGKRVGSNLGKWEKHTKGIGMKLLSKMGYKAGEGLGSGKTGKKGISKVVEVVVRPNNLGLGFGSFVEASQLKVNKELEGELHGKDIAASNKDEQSIRNKSSAAEILVQEGNWRKRRLSSKQKRKKKFSRHEIDSSIDKEKDELIIDMRGPSALTQGSTKDHHELGSVFVESVSLFASTTEAKFQTSSLLLSSTLSKIQTIEEDMKGLESKVALLDQREQCLNEIEQDLADINTFIKSTVSSKSANAKSCQKALDTFSRLKIRFPNEYGSLNLSKIAPDMLGPLYNEFLSTWKALEYPEVILQVLNDWRNILPENMVVPTIYTRYLLPRIRYAISSWDVLSPSFCIVMYRTLSTALSNQDDVFGIDEILDQRQSINAIQNIQENLILPKIRSYITHWDPFSSDKVHEMVLPWKPYLEVSYFNLILNDIKKKIRASLASNWDVLNSSFLDVVVPWKDEFEGTSMEHTFIEMVVPRLVRFYSTFDLLPSNVNQLGKILMRWIELIPQLYFKSIIEGEFLPNWISKIYDSLSSKKVDDFNDAIKVYSFLKSSLTNDLFFDPVICKYFYTALLMIKYRMDGEDIPLELIPDRNRLSYRSVLRRRKKEVEVQNQAQEIDPSLKKSNLFNGYVPGVTKSFREAVEDLLSENNLLLQPRIGSNSNKDGKQVYECGKQHIPIYFDQNIVYVFKDKEWQPISVDFLISLST